MKKGTRWIVIDTETDGLCAPIHVVELAAQRMCGWERDGEPFRMFLNHNVHIPAEATAVHGYTRAFLQKHGRPPLQVHAAFREYAHDCPFVAHNLSYDWDRCLVPEWASLGIPAIGRRGFCSMTLSRRVAPESRSYKLDVLKAAFRLSNNRSHEALSDVLTVVELLQKICRPRLESAGLDSFEAIAAFAKKTPLSRCHEILKAEKAR